MSGSLPTLIPHTETLREKHLCIEPVSFAHLIKRIVDDPRKGTRLAHRARIDDH